MNSRGFTLIELMFSLLLFGVTASAMTSGFRAMQQQNLQNEVRSGAIGAAQQVLDELRLTDPTTLPTNGSASQNITYGARTYTVTTSYCALSSYCTSSSIRQIRLGVTYDGQTRYQVDTVFCQLR